MNKINMPIFIKPVRQGQLWSWNVETTTFIIIWVALCISISKTYTYTYMIVKYKVCRDEVDIQIRLPLKNENILVNFQNKGFRQKWTW